MEKIAKMLELNDEQIEIFKSRARTIAVTAGAGTGKTRLLVARYLAELESGGSDIQSIAAITFTENAAAELRERIGIFIGRYVREFGERGNLKADAPGKLSAAPISTIHGLAARIMRENLFDTDFPSGFETADEYEAETIIGKAVFETILKLRASRGVTANALDELLENESFNLEAVVRNTVSIIRETSAKHLPLPLKRPEVKNGFSVRQIQKLIAENEAGFLSAGSRKRYEKARNKINTSAHTDSVVCKNLKEIWEEMDGITKSKKAEMPEKLCAEKIKNCAGEAVDTLNARLTDQYLIVAQEAMKLCAEMKIERSVIDYEDLLTNALKILETNRSALARYQKRFGLIMVDEFQDTDSLQSGIIELLRGETGKLIVVGDKMQSIYGFRGAEPELFDNFLTSTGVEHFRMPTNYRTCSGLTGFLNGFFTNIFDDYSPMKSVRDDEGTFETFPAGGKSAGENRENEALFIAGKISELLQAGRYSYKDIALIFRRSSNMTAYERALQSAGIAFKRRGTAKFFALTEIRDIISMMKFIDNPLDERAEAAILRSPFFGMSDEGLARYFSEKKAEKSGSRHGLLRALAQGGDEEPSLAAQFLLAVIEEKDKINISSPFVAARFAACSMGYAAGALALPNGGQIHSNITKFTEMCAELEQKGVSLPEAISRFDARKDRHRELTESGETDDSVTLLTCHASKGLEFPVVFLADTNYSPARIEGAVAASSKTGVMVRHDQCGIGTWKEIAGERKDTQEEKRILYVALTRAADLVFTQKHEKPYRSSLAAIIESGLAKLPRPAEKIRKTPAEKKTEIIQKTRDTEKIRKKATGANWRPLFNVAEIKERQIPQFCPVAKTEEGEIIHRFFEIWDFSPDTVESLAEFAASEKFVSQKSVREKIAECAANVLKSPLARMVREANARHTEYEFTLETGKNQKELRSGKIDLILETQRGTVIVDYKYTDFFEAEKYAEQIEFYCGAIEKIYGERPVESYICVLPGAELKNV